MKDIKMSECFSMPLTIVVHKDCCDEFESLVKDSRDDYMFVFPEDIDVSAVVHAINSHDSLVDQLAAANEEIEGLSLRNELMVKLGSKANSELRQEVELLTNELAAAKAELQSVTEVANRYIKRNEESKESTKKEIAEYRKLLNVIATIGDKGMAKSINVVLAKHKGE